MHIKILRHKRLSTISHLLSYMIDGMQSERDMMIAHNLPNFDLEDMAQAFITNDQYRTDPRATVVAYHEILSFAPGSSAQIDNQKLEQMTREYIRRRNPDSVCFAVSHMGDNHKHAHLCFSAVEYKSSKSLRMSDEVFRELREGMEQWQRKHFPELQHSIVYLGRERKKHRSRQVQWEKNKRKEKQVQAKKRLGKKPLKKEQLALRVRKCYNQSRSMEDFVRQLGTAGLEVYERGGKVVGVVRERKYRFGTLGIDAGMLLSLDRFAARQREIEALARRDEGFDLER